jgi:hypothetical protein
MATSEGAGFGMGWAATVGSFAAPVAIMLWQAASSVYESGGLSLSLGPIFLIGTPISLLATWLFGLPFALYLRRRKSLNVMAVCVGGVVIGAAFFITLLWLVSLPSASTAQVPGQAIVGGVLGLLVALTFACWHEYPSEFRRVEGRSYLHRPWYTFAPIATWRPLTVSCRTVPMDACRE